MAVKNKVLSKERRILRVFNKSGFQADILSNIKGFGTCEDRNRLIL